jgi:phosphatidylglycerol:prolipoprotein diacylglycerol transferase
VVAVSLAFFYVRRHNLDFRLLLDAVAPALLIGQAIVRPANYINQELYGPPTGLPWGIPIEAAHRIPPWNDMVRFPEETTRFHPAFAYEMVWNFAAAGFLLWAARRFSKRLRPGALFAGWLILAGAGRVWLEWFRPDQPRVPGTAISYSRIAAALMTLAGVIWLLLRYDVIRLSFISPGSSSYEVRPREESQPADEASGES